MKNLYSLILALGISVATASAHAGDSEQKHDHSAMHKHAHKALDVSNYASRPSLSLEVLKDKMKGWNIHLITENFRFAPEHVNEEVVEGEGHAHVYINDKKTRLYGNWIHVGSLPKGENIIRATLNANNHAELAIGDKPITAEISVKVD